jgi:lysophospholipase L1-like esterase
MMSKKRILFVGDSIALALRDPADEQGLRGWAKRVCAAYSMEGVNAAIGGAALNSKTRTKRFGKEAMIAQQIRVHRGEPFDYVLIHGGLNDAWDDVPLGKIGDSFEEFDDTTFAGALETTFAAAIEAFGPEVKLGWIINFNCPEHSVTSNAEEYYAWGKKVCEKWGIPDLDLFSLPYDCKALNDDVLHPHSGGYEYLSPFIIEFIPKMNAATK